MRCGRDAVDSSAPLSPPRILISLGGLECLCPEPVVHIATKPEPLLQCLDDLVRSVTDPVLVETLPGHVGIEYCADSFLVAFTEGTKIVKDDGLEILLTLGDHRRNV